MPHAFADRWNHNSHYYPMIDALVPERACTVLDIGCGDGTLARHLTRPGRVVHDVDVDAVVLPASEAGTVFAVGSAEALAHGPAAVDAVTMVMVLHHLDARRALAEVRRVLRPGGTAVVLGFGQDATPVDRLWSARDVVVHRWLSRRGRPGNPRAPGPISHQPADAVFRPCCQHVSSRILNSTAQYRSGNDPPR